MEKTDSLFVGGYRFRFAFAVNPSIRIPHFGVKYDEEQKRGSCFFPWDMIGDVVFDIQGPESEASVYMFASDGTRLVHPLLDCDKGRVKNYRIGRSNTGKPTPQVECQEPEYHEFTIVILPPHHLLAGRVIENLRELKNGSDELEWLACFTVKLNPYLTLIEYDDVGSNWQPISRKGNQEFLDNLRLLTDEELRSTGSIPECYSSEEPLRMEPGYRTQYTDTDLVPNPQQISPPEEWDTWTGQFFPPMKFTSVVNEMARQKAVVAEHNCST